MQDFLNFFGIYFSAVIFIEQIESRFELLDFLLSKSLTNSNLFGLSFIARQWFLPHYKLRKPVKNLSVIRSICIYAMKNNIYLSKIKVILNHLFKWDNTAAKTRPMMITCRPKLFLLRRMTFNLYLLSISTSLCSSKKSQIYVPYHLI